MIRNRVSWQPIIFAGAVCFLAEPDPAVADSPKINVQLRDVTLKENGRIEPVVLKHCDVQKSFRDAIVEKQSKVNAKRKRKSDTESHEVDVRVDKIARLGMGSAGVKWGGLEVGVTATVVASPSVHTYLVCRKNVFGAAGPYAYCATIDSCSQKILDDISTWLEHANTKAGIR